MRNLKGAVDRLSHEYEMRGAPLDPQHWMRLLRFTVGRFAFPVATVAWNTWYDIIRKRKRRRQNIETVKLRTELMNLIVCYRDWKTGSQAFRDHKTAMSSITCRLYADDLHEASAQWKSEAEFVARMTVLIRQGPIVRRYWKRWCTHNDKINSQKNVGLPMQNEDNRRLSMYVQAKQNGLAIPMIASRYH